MATIVDSLLITLGVDTKGVSEGMNRAEGKLETSAKNIISNILQPLAAALALGGAFKEYIKNGDALKTLSETLGESVENIDAWGQAVERQGGSAAGLQGTLTSLNSKMLEFSATGTSSALPVLSQMGVSARDANGGIKSSVDILQDLANVAHTMPVDRFKALSQSLGIDEGTINLLKKGGPAVQELINKQKALGVYTEKDAEIARQFTNTFKDLMQVFKSVNAIIMRVLVPPLTFMTEKLVTFVTFVKQHETFLNAVFAGLAAVITRVLVPAIVRMGAAMLANPLTWIFIAVMTAVLAVAAVVDDLITYIRGGESAFAGFWAMFGTGEEIAYALAQAWEFVKLAFAVLWDIVKYVFKTWLEYAKLVIGVVGDIISVLAGVGQAMYDGIGAAITWMVEAFKQAKQAIMAVIQPVIDVISSVKDGLASIPGVSDISDAAGNAWGATKNFFGGMFGGDEPTASTAMRAGGNTSTSNKTVTSTVSVGEVIVQTNATDAKGIANAITPALDNTFGNLAIVGNAGL